MNDEFLNKLRRYFNLNLYEVKVWTALLSRGSATAGELSDIANVPRSRSYDVLESLEKKGFVVVKFGKPIKYLAVPPEEVVERAKKNMLKEAEEKVQKLEELKDSEIIQELKSLHERGIELVEPHEKSGSLKGRHNLYNHLEFLFKSASKSISCVTTEKEFVRLVETLKPTLESAAKRGVKIRFATEFVDKEEMKQALKDIEGIGEVRKLKNIKARFVIVDGEELMFMIMHDEEVHPSYDVGIWVNTPFFASALEELFEIAWKELEVIKTASKKK
ncbi:MAG: HTH-type transcriptional regulator, sugar sensing transcriptional regulator [Candidatus Woesearchaeota archaeon]|nr:HTH-type transcriptional regulator, sugar sensing transcriptional regulator [Candidatus Woesearchaeota archaeon]MDN5327840.1 HTH-type transcriptional regulator, sugar sensing transcriptional regulator [Candidatus Woesearchaeota archaeon]